jgi:hypothetical protein
VTFEQLVQHLACAPCFHPINERYFGVTLAAFLAQIVPELAVVGAADWHYGVVANRIRGCAGSDRPRARLIVVAVLGEFAARSSRAARTARLRAPRSAGHMQAAVTRTTKATSDHIPVNTGMSPNTIRRSSSDELIAASRVAVWKAPLCRSIGRTRPNVDRP